MPTAVMRHRTNRSPARYICRDHLCIRPWVLSRIAICLMAIPEPDLRHEARSPHSALSRYAPENLRSVGRLYLRLLFVFSRRKIQLLRS